MNEVTMGKKIWFVRAHVRVSGGHRNLPTGLILDRMELVVAKETAKQFTIGRNVGSIDLPCRAIVNKSQLQDVFCISSVRSTEGFYAYCYEEDADKMLAICVEKLQSGVQQAYNSLIPTVKIISDAGYEIKGYDGK